MKPVLQALLIADHIYEDKLTGKKIIAGVFHRVFAIKRQPPDNPPAAGPQGTKPGAPESPAPGPTQEDSSSTSPPTSGAVSPPPASSPGVGGGPVIAGMGQVTEGPVPQSAAPSSPPPASPPSNSPPSNSPPSNSPPGEPPQRTVDIRQLQRAGSPYAYISLTEVKGRTSLRLQCVDLYDGQLMFGTDIEVDSPSPLETVEVVAALPPLPAGRGDRLAVELLYDGELLGAVRIAIERR